MNATTLRASALPVPLQEVFGDASANLAQTQSVWVEVEDCAGNIGYGEACPRDYLTRESLSGALAYIQGAAGEWCARIRDLDSLRAWVAAHDDVIDVHPAAWSAVELAMLDLFARRAGVSVETLLGLPPLAGVYTYTAVLGDGSSATFEAALARYVEAGFTEYKVRLGGRGAHDRAKTAALRAAGIAPDSVRADASHLFRNARDAVRYLDRLDYPFAALEEPVPAHDLDGLAAVARACDCAIVLDPRRARATMTALASGVDWRVNLRVATHGGILRCLDQAAAAAAEGHGVIVGAQVGETSLLSRAALTVAHGSRAHLKGQEGAFGLHLLARDTVSGSLTFGAGGRLDARAVPQGPGFGFVRVVRP
ncbi:MAG: mandelate racemase/muconate lactonizing enzyme family protein [Gammaproteobacteria bacterium]